MKNKLKAYRALLNLTQAEMAKKLGISTTSYSLKETGQTDFKNKEMIKIVEIIKKVDKSITMDHIFGE